MKIEIPTLNPETHYEGSVHCCVCRVSFSVNKLESEYPRKLCDGCLEMLGPIIDEKYKKFKENNIIYSFWYRWLKFKILDRIAYKMWQNEMRSIKHKAILKNRRERVKNVSRTK